MKWTTLTCGALAGLSCLSLTGLGPLDLGVAEASSTTVRINGVATPVYFNDGDTFRALAGPMRNHAARLAGFNTLESYGPAHQWGGFSAREMYALAKAATSNARRGMWNCAIDPSDKDGYGRLLAICPDLQLDQIGKGLAHALSIAGPAAKPLILAQRSAIVNRRGIWAKGVPAMVLTSTHSVDERFDNQDNYNRLVSPLDGQSTKWKHQEKYTECQNVCWPALTAERDKLVAVIAELRADDTTKSIVHGYEDPYLLALLAEYVATGRVAQVFDAQGDQAVKKKLDRLKENGAFGSLKTQASACMIYVDFERRYRIPPKPECLK